MKRRDFLLSTASALTVASLASCQGAVSQSGTIAPQLKVSPNRRYLVDGKGNPFFLLGDTPWFLQKLPIAEVRVFLDDRRKKGFNTLFLELLDDSTIVSRDGNDTVAFNPETDITQPVEAYWNYAEQVLEEVEQRGFFVILSNLWYGAGEGLWKHHVTPENASIYGAFLGRRFARFKNLMWMHGGDLNPDDRLAVCTRNLATTIQAAAPHHLHTVHNSPEFSSAAFHNDDPWLDVNLGYTYGIAYLHILPEYQRTNPIRPVILGETGYEGEGHNIWQLPNHRDGDLWTPYLIRRNAWWSVLSGAVGYCAGSKIWRWESDWREIMQVRSMYETPHILTLMQSIDWWKLVPDAQHQFVSAGYGQWETINYVTAALTEDGRSGVVYLPNSATVTINLSQFQRPVQAFWFDPTSAALTPARGVQVANNQQQFSSPGRNSAKEPDWVLLFKA